MTSLYIIRGLPGSGKSTLARKLADQYRCNYYEADQYFMVEGEYKFDPTKLHQAHSACYRNVAGDIANGRDAIVSNTFTTIKELRDYFQLANDYGCVLTIIECTGNYGSVHNVPEASIQRMRDRWDDADTLWEYGENFQRLATMIMIEHGS